MHSLHNSNNMKKRWIHPHPRIQKNLLVCSWRGPHGPQKLSSVVKRYANQWTIIVCLQSVCIFSLPRQRSRVWNRSRQSVCVFVCLSVIQHSQTVWDRDLKESRATYICHIQIKWLLGGLLGRNTDKEGITREGRKRSGVFILFYFCFIQ